MSDPENQNLLVFGDFAWPKATKTNYKMYSTAGSDVVEYYTLESIYFLLTKVQLPHTQYVREAASNGISVIRRPDRKELLAYLQGNSTQPKSIDSNVELTPAIHIRGSAQEEQPDIDMGAHSPAEMMEDEHQVVSGHGTPHTNMSMPPPAAQHRELTPKLDGIEDHTAVSSPEDGEDQDEFPDQDPMEYDDISTSYVPSEFTARSEVSGVPSSKRSKMSNGTALSTSGKSPLPGKDKKSKLKPDKSLKDQMGKDKMATIREKILRRNLEKQQKADKQAGMMQVPRDDGGHTPGGDGMQMDLDPTMIGPEAANRVEPTDVHKIILQREKTWQTRHTVLQVPSKSFKDVLKIVDDVHKDKKN